MCRLTLFLCLADCNEGRRNTFKYRKHVAMTARTAADSAKTVACRFVQPARLSIVITIQSLPRRVNFFVVLVVMVVVRGVAVLFVAEVLRVLVFKAALVLAAAAAALMVLLPATLRR